MFPRYEGKPNKSQARRRVAAWIEEYNHDRRHSALGMRSPIAYELALYTGEAGDLKPVQEPAA
jgi:putative transposase